MQHLDGIHEGQVVKVSIGGNGGVIRGPFGMPDLPFQATTLMPGHRFDESLLNRRVRFEVGAWGEWQERQEAINVEPLS
jgi:hypothetical protein